MNLTISSSGSGQSEGEPTASETPAAASKSRAKKSVAKDLDHLLKLKLASALASSGHYTRINVLLSATSSRGLADVTDIDVLAIRYDLMFRRDAIAVSCKSGASKGFSPAREAFYLRGVLDYVDAREGVAAFSQKALAPHLRDLGQRLGILMLTGDEVAHWCDQLTNGIEPAGYFTEAEYAEYLQSWERLNSYELTDYLRTDYWFHFDFRNLQNVMAHMRKISGRWTGKDTWQSVIALDITAHLCLTVLDLCRQVRMLDLSSINETTAAYLFGGATSLKARRDLYGRVQKLLSSTGIAGAGGNSLPALEPAYTQGLAELSIRFIERPHAAILIPLVLQDNLWRLLGAQGVRPSEDKNFLAAEKLAQDLVDFTKAATGTTWMPRI